MFFNALKQSSYFGRLETSREIQELNVHHLHPSRAYFGGVIKTHLNPSPMITLDHLGESTYPTLNIPYINDNACFKFGGVWCPFV